MPEITKDELQKILQVGKVDVGNDTLFSKVNKLQVRNDRLTLVISSGGSGASAIKQAIATAKQKLKSDFAVYMKFIMVDSATEEINAAGNALGKQQLQILNISTPGASERLRPENRDDFFKEFVHAKYDYTQLNGDGSAQDRMTGRIKFYDDAKEGNFNDVKFRHMITSLYGEGQDWGNLKTKPVDIMILAGLSGGNGSGTFQDLAAHARYACEQAGAPEVRVFGYLFLPDTVENFEKNNPEKQGNLYSNGYAALKELESRMSIPFNPERKETFPSRDIGVRNINSTVGKPLFDYPVLISGGYEESKSMMAESIINLAVASAGNFNQNSFYSNSVTARNAHLNNSACLKGGLLKTDEFPEDSRRYAGIGYAYAAIPDEIVTANVVSNVCGKLYQQEEKGDGSKSRFCTEKSRMGKFEMESQIRRLFAFGKDERLEASSLWNKKISGALRAASTLTRNENEITRADINAGKIEDYEKGFHTEKCVTDGTKRFQNHLAEIYHTFEENAVQVMKEYGPRAIEYLFTGKGPDDIDGKPQFYTDISIFSMLNDAKNQMNRIIGEHKSRPDNDIPGGLGEILLKRKITEWKSKFHTALEHETKQQIVRNTIGTEGAWEQNITRPLTEYLRRCQCFADRLEMLTDFYHSAGSPLDDKDYDRFLNASQEGNCVNLCNSNDVYAWVKEQVVQKINSVSTDDVKKKLIDSFTARGEDWISESEGKTRKEFDRVMSQCCGLGAGAGAAASIIELSTTSYFEHVLEQVEPEEVATKADQMVSGIVGQLLTKSQPSLKKSGGYCTVNKFVMIPKSLQVSKFGTAILAAFNSAVTATDGAGVAGVAVSESVSEVVCYQTSVANALYDLQELSKWEEYYNKSSSVSRHMNNGEFGGSYVEKTKTEIETLRATKEGRKTPELHLASDEEIIFGTGLSWEHYPALALRNLKDNKKENEYLKTIFYPIVEYALREKIIEREHSVDGNQNKYQYRVNLIPESWENLDVSDYNELGEDGRLKRGEKLFQYLKNQNVLSEDVWQKPIQLSGSGFFDGPYDFSTAKTSGKGMVTEKIEDYSIQYMKRILRKNTKLFLELRETLCRYYEVVKELEERDGAYWHVYEVKKFAEYYKFGVIFEDEGKWYYQKDLRGNRQVFCSFSIKDTAGYGKVEDKLLKGDWKFLLAFRSFTKQDLAMLEEVKQDKLNDMEEEELEMIVQRNESVLGKMKERIEQEILERYPNRTPEEAVRKSFDLSNTEDDIFYIKSIEAILENWDMQTEPGRTPSKGWICPGCGRENEVDVEMCPKCGTAKRQNIVKEGWICPKCGRENEADFEICPKCGTVKRQNIAKEGWICPKCGRENEADFEVCPKCGTARS